METYLRLLASNVQWPEICHLFRFSNTHRAHPVNTKLQVLHDSSMVKSLPIHDLEGRDDQGPSHSKESNLDTTTIPHRGRGRILLSMDLDGIEYHAAIALLTDGHTWYVPLQKKDGNSFHR